MKYFHLVFAVLLASAGAQAQAPQKPNAADIHQSIKKLNVLGSVLYVAAHPDDENQRLISYCANEKLYDVTYLSLTRGDGGQNLIGPELRELLGVLRTQELLMARSVDGGKQLFSRANDFGYSKTPEETLEIWNKDAVLSDVVWAIRKTRPDVIVNRFFHGDKYRTHGHHTASAMLSVEAFDLAGSAEVYPEQLAYVSPWQPQRIFFNTSWWFYGSREKFDAADKTTLYPVDIGVYFPLKGKSNTEVAAEARSKHRCQGFGAMSYRGETEDWLDLIKGDAPADKDPFSGINTTWSRVPGAEPIARLLAEIDANFRADDPAASVPGLLSAMQMIKALPDGHWKRRKLTDIKEVIRHCLGLYLETTAAVPSATPGETVNIRMEAVNRSAHEVVLGGIMFSKGVFDTVSAALLANNRTWELTRAVRIPEDAALSTPYWLNAGAANGMYAVEDQLLRGLPETPPLLEAVWSLTVNGIPIEFATEVAYKIEEPSLGEIWRPFDVLPPVFVEFDQSSYVFNAGKREVRVKVTAGKDQVSGTVMASGPPGWPGSCEEGSNAFSFAKKGESRTFTFTIDPAGGPESVWLEARASVDGKGYSLGLRTIRYDHIPTQSVLLPARARASRLSLVCTAKKIGYYMGAGDEVPESLRQIGCEVKVLDEQDFADPDGLDRFDAIVVGIRAYNTREELKFRHRQLLDYASRGGTLVVQYNNSFDLVLDDLAPYSLKLSRTRVTDETAPVTFAAPQHPVLNTPNKIGDRDFEDWVQERGLYFPGEWDDRFAAPLSCNDPGEDPASGAVLVAPYGRGHYVYTGISFFRQLPAGVPGAYRLFANLISLGNPE